MITNLIEPTAHIGSWCYAIVTSELAGLFQNKEFYELAILNECKVVSPTIW